MCVESSVFCLELLLLCFFLWSCSLCLYLCDMIRTSYDMVRAIYSVEVEVAFEVYVSVRGGVMSEAEVIHVYRLLYGGESVCIGGAGVDVWGTCEECFNILIDPSTYSQQQHQRLVWLLSETYEPSLTSSSSFLNPSSVIIEVGPRLSFSSSWSSNCVSMCRSCGISSVHRVERSRRYAITSSSVDELTAYDLEGLERSLYDRMTESVYKAPIQRFDIEGSTERVIRVPVMREGREALERINLERGLGFDDWDLDYYTDLFKNKLGRDPSDVECFDLAQSNSEHSRHWFFSGRIVVDGQEKDRTLFSMVKSTLSLASKQPSNSVIAFHDNSSAIYGFDVNVLCSSDPTSASRMILRRVTLHPILTAETHNFPSGVAPFPGAETGTGGRLRDVQATGRGAHTVAGICGYCVGNLHLPSHPLPWETPENYSSTLAHPREIVVEASNGASDYGNKYGEPVVCGFARSFGLRLHTSVTGTKGRRIEWIKPIMFTAGVGALDSTHACKGAPEVGMVVCKLGGPAYRIGLGGGAASSREQGTVESHLDFNAVQRGDAQMENRMNRVIRGCVEMGESNPIVSIHDQGAGGNGNVLKEVVDPLGAVYDIRSIPLGDPTLSVMEIWGAEYQENNAILVHEEFLSTVLKLGERENCPVSPVGRVTGNGRVVVRDSVDGSVPFDLPLSMVLGKMPQKTFTFTSPVKDLHSLDLPTNITVAGALERVLRLMDVGSKRFLTNKVDRSVTGLVSQQQCVGPLHTPLADVAVLAQSHFGVTGVATAVGEQPIKGLINSAAQARLTAGEALTNLMWARVTGLCDVKASCNWMWAAKLEGEGAKMWETCEAISNFLLTLGPSIDGGKDSLSMAATVDGEIVPAPGQVTLTVYAACPDITQTVTPDLKAYGTGEIIYVDLSGLRDGGRALGGTALSTVYGQLGDTCADVRDPLLLRRAFETVQLLLNENVILSGHDRSDGGLIVCLLEMAFAGNCGLRVDVPADPSGDTSEIKALQALFSEDLGLVLEVLPHNTEFVMRAFTSSSVPCVRLGRTGNVRGDVSVCYGGRSVVQGEVAKLRDVWESTSFALESRQCNVLCVNQEKESLLTRYGCPYRLTFKYELTPHNPLSSRPRVAILREEGTNGDREMMSAFYWTGFEPWDVNMRDLMSGEIDLSCFRGVIFCGGFSYADVNGSAKGWAGAIRFNSTLKAMFKAFKDRVDTFSLGVCNGCQLMALMGWVPFQETEFVEESQPRFVHNISGRFESRWCTVRVMPPGPSQAQPVFLRGMADAVLGIWSAHGEGRVVFPGDKTGSKRQLQKALDDGLAPIRYVDDAWTPTEKYPMNPNGSACGIAALCSRDGRHLAMMPHPERCFIGWQWPYAPMEWRQPPLSQSQSESRASPWVKLFSNAFDFCVSSLDM